MTSDHAVPDIRGFHAHVYFGPDTLEQARALCEQAAQAFPQLKMGRVHERPVGPHPDWSCQLAFKPELFGSVIPWLALRRGALVVFIHPITNNDLVDHRDRAMWMGAVRPLDLSVLGTGAGIAFFMDAVILLVFGEKQRGVPKIVGGVLNWDFRLIMPYDRILIGVLALLSIAAFILFMSYSRTGRALRAMAQDRVAAQLMGVDVDRYAMIGFALGAMLAGLVGGLLVTITGVNLGMGGPTSIKAFLMVMIGGAGVISGAIAGGFILGMMESVGLTLLSAYGDITYLVIFASLMVFLAIRPQGLMGKPWG